MVGVPHVRTSVRGLRKLGRSPIKGLSFFLSCNQLDCRDCRIHDYLLRRVIHRRAGADRACRRSSETRSRSSAKTRATRSAEPGPVVGSGSIVGTEPVIRTRARTVTKAKTTIRATIHSGATVRAYATIDAGTATAAVDSATACNDSILGRIKHKFPLVVMGLLLINLDRRFLIQQSNAHDRRTPDRLTPGDPKALLLPPVVCTPPILFVFVPVAPVVVVPPPVPVDEPNPLPELDLCRQWESRTNRYC